MEKLISTNVEETYNTKNTYSDSTKYIWFVCHGYGQLAKYFIRRFDVLDKHEHYIIAPEGLSKFYLDGNYSKVGASWLTKENRELHLKNQLNYLEKVYRKEVESIDFSDVEIVLFGFSQGVATICRWAAQCKIPFKKLILWAGSFPSDITKENFDFIDEQAKIFLVIGDEDQFLTYIKIDDQIKIVTDLCLPPTLVKFAGGHEVKRDVLTDIVNSF